MIRNIYESVSWDIEATTITKYAKDLPLPLYKEWKHSASKRLGKLKTDMTEEDCEVAWRNYAAFYPEFSKIICISFTHFLSNGLMDMVGNHLIPQTNTISFYGDNEEKIIKDSLYLFQNIYNNGSPYTQIGVALRYYDIPFYMRKCEKYGIKSPTILRMISKCKPWETDNYIFDPQVHHSFGASNMSYTRLGMLCNEYGIPTPKEGMEGHDVHTVYHSDNKNILKIKGYCERDTISALQLAFVINKINE